MSPIVNVFGVSGVGKTSACRSFVRRHSGYLHLIASAVLSEVTGLSPKELGRRDTDEIVRQQALLIDAVVERTKSCQDVVTLLDGNAIIDTGDDLVPVPVQLMTRLGPSGMILLEAPPEVIRSRRLADNKYRSGRTVLEIALQMEATRQVVQNFSSELGIPLEKGSSAHGEFDRAVFALLKQIKTSFSQDNA